MHMEYTYEEKRENRINTKGWLVVGSMNTHTSTTTGLALLATTWSLINR